MSRQRQITFAPHGHVLTNANVWSRDSRWIAFDVRSDPAGSRFDGARIAQVDVETGTVRTLYESGDGACCGVVTCHPKRDEVVFIRGPLWPTHDWSYGPARRQGVIANAATGLATNLDARDLTPPFTPGALRGGTHVHVFSGDGQWVSFTYEDHILDQLEREDANAQARRDVSSSLVSGTDIHPPRDLNQRNVGVSVAGRSVVVPATHSRNHDGSHFSVLVTHTVNAPTPGSDEISRAFEDAWVGDEGYLRGDGARQRRAIAFQGQVVTRDGRSISEPFIVDIPDDVTQAGDEPLQGTATRRPAPPRGTAQRRLCDTSSRRFPGLQGPRHWLRSTPDGSRIAMLMRDDAGVVQVWTVSPRGGTPRQLTRDAWDIASAFTFSSDGRFITYIADGSVFVADVVNGESRRLTERCEDASAPRPEACVFSPDGRRIAFVRTMPAQGAAWNQIFVVEDWK